MLLRVLKLFKMNYLRSILKVKHEECRAQENQPKGDVDRSFAHFDYVGRFWFRIRISASQTGLNSLPGALEPAASGASKNVACSHSSKPEHAFFTRCRGTPPRLMIF